MCSNHPTILKQIRCLLFICLSLVSFTSAAAKTDLVFIVDGSGSINSNDWNIQRQGIIAALQDPLVVPRDGSISVTVVQFSGSARVEFPYRVMDSEADIQAAISRVNGMSQYRSSTRPSAGIDVATSHLLSISALPDDFQSYCLSTDGRGGSLTSSIANAKNANFALDRFSVIAIEDPPFFFEADAHAFYGPHVFGGGAVFVVSSFTEFAGFVGSLCLGEPLKLVGMEVTQVIQDLENKVKLVEKKKTLVRTYLEPKTGTDPVKATARLKGTRNGSDLPGSPLTAVNAGGSIVAKPDALDRRNNLGDSLNFQLPDSWLTGTVTLELEGIGGTLECKEAAGPSANDCKTTVTFNSGSEFEVKLVRVKYKNGATTIEPSSAEMNELERRLLATFPTSKIDRTTGRLDMGTVNHPQAEDVNSRLATMRFLDFCWSGFPFFCDRLYYGAVDQTGRLRYGTGFTGGLANGIPGTTSSGVIRDANSYGRNRHGHEIAHTMGRHHASNALLVGTSGTTELGPCGSGAGAAAPNFPNIFTVNGSQKATIGPMNSGDNKLVFGWDSQRNSVVDPTKTFAMMSYCGPFRWPSDFSYEAIRGYINSNYDPAFSVSGASAASSFGAASLSGVTQSWTLVRGIIDTEAATMEFKPVATFDLDDTITPPTPAGNDYALIVKDGAGNELSRTNFSVVNVEADAEDGDLSTNEERSPLAILTLPVKTDPSAKSFVVQRNSDNTELGSLFGSDNAPNVTVVYPNGGENLNPPSVDLSWTASDADGDDLVYTVQFSPDNGATWETLVTDHTDTTLSVLLGDIGKTTQGLLRVQASDGFNTGQDESDGTFITPNTAPTCDITSPTDGASFVGVQPIILEAFTSDTEEGTASNVQWASNLDGNIGNGASITTEQGSGNLPSGIRRLREGNHTITMTCTDGGGLSASDTVDISISLIQAQVKGDADNDGDVDRNDLLLIRNDLNKSADGSLCGAKCDMNDDNKINSLDMRLAVLACTRTSCAVN